ncbi:MAG: LexA family transcriptional regulator [Pseudomonadota bacterium]
MKIHLTLKSLMQMKSERDGANFTLYQLAKALNMPHSILSRLVHSQPNKRVNNPRIDTLFKIVEFFKTDGFNVTINDLLMGFEENTITIQDQKLDSFLTEVKLPLYSFNTSHSEKVGMASIKLTRIPDNAIAFLSAEAIQPLFKQGSIFIVDTQLKPKKDSLVAIKLVNNDRILIKKIHIERNKKWLKSIDNSANPVILESRYHSIVGVIIQINAKN